VRINIAGKAKRIITGALLKKETKKISNINSSETKKFSF